jgi:hypothetical protein
VKRKLIIAAGVALVLSLCDIQAQNAPGPKGKGQGGPAINKPCPQPDCPVGGQGPCGQGLRKGPANGKGNGKCLRDGTGPNCPKKQVT